MVPRSRQRVCRSIVLLVSFCLTAVGIHCVDEPVAPNWDVTLSVPLINRTFTLMELVEKDTLVTPDPLRSGLLVFSTEREYQSTNIGTALTLKIDDATRFADVSIPASDIIPGLPPNPLVNMVVPALADVDLGSQSLRAFERFDIVTFNSGELTLTIRNTLPVDVVFPQPLIFVNASGEEIFTASVSSIPPDSTDEQVVDLSGKTITRDNTVALHVGTPGSNGSVVTISADAGLEIAITLLEQTLSIREVQGRVEPNTVTIDEQQTFDIAEFQEFFQGNITFARANLVLHLRTPPEGYPYAVTGVLTGRNSITSEVAQLPLPDGGRVYQAGLDSVVFDPADVATFLNQFSMNFPDEFRLNAQVVVNPNDEIGRITDQDLVDVTVQFGFDLIVAVASGIIQDTSQISAKVDRDLLDRINFGRVTLEFENGLPFEIEVDSITLLDESQTTLLSLPKAGQPAIRVDAGVVTGGHVTAPSRSTSYIELDSEDTEKFDPSEFAAFSFRIVTAEGGSMPVEFRKDDFVHIEAYVTLSWRTDF